MLPNVELRRLEQRDMYKLQSIVKQQIAQKSNLSWPFDRAAATSFIQDYNTWGIWINGQVLAGAIEVKPDLETAYFVAEQFQNKGIATAAVKQIMKVYSDRQLWCVVNPSNVASMRVAQKALMRMQFVQL